MTRFGGNEMEHTSKNKLSFSTPIRTSVPGPRGYPLLGVLPEFAKDSLGFLLRAALEYGDIAHYRLANLDFYQINHPDGIQQVLQANQHNYTKQGFDRDFLRPILGNGLFVNDGESWLRQRRLMQPAFHKHQIQNFAGIMTGAAGSLANEWETKNGNHQPLNVAYEMMRLTLDIVNQALFSTHIDEFAGEQLPIIAQAITILIEDISYRFQRPYYTLWLPTRRNARFNEAIRTLDEVIYQLIEARQQLLAEHPEAAPDDLLNTLLTVRDEDTGEGMSKRQVRDEVLTLFIAGHETTAVTLSWAFYLLDRYPLAAGKLQAELQQELNGRPPAIEDLPNLPYLRMLIDETLRLYPPAWITNRCAVQDDIICDYRIPAGALVVLSPYAIHHHPAYWDEPEEFRPERFLPDAVKNRPNFAYFPFGGGPHQCIGRSFAQVEACLVLATVAQRFRLVTAPDWVVQAEALTTLRPKGGLPMLIESR
jgi:cytochrome P450